MEWQGSRVATCAAAGRSRLRLDTALVLIPFQIQFPGGMHPLRPEVSRLGLVYKSRRVITRVYHTDCLHTAATMPVGTASTEVDRVAAISENSVL